MTEALVGVALLVAVAAAPAASDVERAKRAEERAFAAIEGERWCEAMHLFLKANGAAPSVDLTYNAAQAADLADDRRQALKLYVELVGAYPASERQAQVNTRIQELTAKVGKEGEGTPCGPPPADTPEEPAPIASEGADDPAAPAAGEEPGGAQVLPWATAGVGGVLALGGVVLATAGIVPYLQFLGARDEILAAEQAGDDATAPQKQQLDARLAWESWGEPSLWAGAGLLVAGIVVGAGGVTWALLGAPPDEEVAP